MSHIDITLLRANSFGDEEFLKEMIQMFLDNCTTFLMELEGSCVDGYSKNWAEAAHSLKGASAMVGAEEMRSLCAKAQSMDSASSADRHIILNQIKNMATIVCAEIKEIIVS